MTFNPQAFSDFWLLAGALIYAIILIAALRAAQWWRLRDAADLNVLLYALLGVFIIWLLNTNFKNSEVLVGPTLHLLGATLMTLMFGWAFAIVAMSAVLLAFTVMTSSQLLENLYVLPWNALTTCILPVLLSYQLFRLVDRRLPNNFFMYIFICAFFGAALSMASVVLTTAELHYLTETYSMKKLSYSYIPYGLIMMFPEAFLTGMLMSIFVVYRPEWVSTFDDHRYLHKR